MIKGYVSIALKRTINFPKNIQILRLDTDLYQSTKYELEILYPLLKINGLLILDDYGLW